MQPLTTVRAGGREVPYYFGQGLLEQSAEIIARHAGGGRRAIVTSTPIDLLFGRRIRTSFGSDEPATVLMGDGEEAKSYEAAAEIVGQLLRAGARRDSVVIALGGGVIGDTAGFAASIYLRGVDLVQIPTTLLAQIDSSVGGKVAVNHSMGKNLIGSFHQPRCIIADPQTLTTLPQREILSGIFEALKGGVIGDVSLFDLCEAVPDALLTCDRNAIDSLVRKSVVLKARIVTEDEKESDRRRLLNYGHTIGHGIETALGYKGLTHGEAVAWGMIAANAIALRRGFLPAETARRIEEAILRFDPSPIPSLDREAVLKAVLHDKKFTTGKQVMILARAVGDCQIVDDITAEEIRHGIAAVVI